MINSLTVFAAALALIAAPIAIAEQTGPFPGSPFNSTAITIGEKVEELFEQGEYERAYIIYRDELAPIGDKYAQYMVGFMHLMGKGVEEDAALASAWYRLAAERANPKFLLVRDQLLQSLEESDRVRSDVYYTQLRNAYSDVALILELVREDLGQLTTSRTGSRLTGSSGTVTIVDPRSGMSVSGAQYFRQIERRIETRLEFIAEQLGQDELATDADDLNFDLLELRIAQYLDRINDR